MARAHSEKSQSAIWEDKWIPTICYGCNHGPDLIRVHTVNGVAINLEGNKNSPDFIELTKGHGRTCPKPFGFIQKIYNPYRIKSPMKRTNPQKGIGIDPKWVEISWDEALDTIAGEIKRIRALKDPQKAAFVQGGPSRFSNTGTYAAFDVAFGPHQLLTSGQGLRCHLADHVFGNLVHGGYSCEPDASYSNYILVIGGNPRVSGGVGENVLFNEAQARGAKMVVIDPVLSETAAKAEEWIPIKPGTDLALELALINVIMNEIKVVDAEFLKKLTNSPYLVGPDGYFGRDEKANKVLLWDPVDRVAKTFDDDTIKDMALEGAYTVDGVEYKPVFQVLKEHVRQYTPEWASGITNVPASTIRKIARDWVDNARIGSTIEVGGVSLPYRPVSTKVGRGITGNMGSYAGMLCEHILPALVGALETVGGHSGGRVHPKEFGEVSFNRGLVPGPDGMLKLDTYPFAWPPVSYQGHEILFPFSKCLPYFYTSFGFKHLVEPRADFPIPPVPEFAIIVRANPLLTIGEPEVIAQALSKIKFFVSIAYTRDETTELADIVLPDHTEFERFELVTQPRWELSRHFVIKALRQPVVEPLHNTREISDIMTEIADRAGFLDNYNAAVNKQLGLGEAYKLEAGKKYAWLDIVDRHCKSATNGAHDLKWFKENGAEVAEVKPETLYSVHKHMLANKLRYPIPYMEDVKRTGEEMAKNLAKVGVKWWPTTEYTPLPVWVPPVLDEVPPEYDFYVTISRCIETSFGMNADMPWLIDIGEHNLGKRRIVMNKRVAEARGIKDGEEIWVESEVGKVKGKVKLVEGIQSQTILIAGQFGQWSTPVAKDTKRVTQTTLVPIRPSWTDPVMGAMQGNTVKAKVYKA